MESIRTSALVINAPEFFADPKFVAWLDNGKPKFTWHRPGCLPGEYSDVIVSVDPGLSGEGADSDMPSHIWDQIVAECRKYPNNPQDPHILVRLTNLDG